MSAFYDLFVGISSFAAGVVANHFGYSAAFLMALGALVAAAVAGLTIFAPEQSEPVPDEVHENAL